MAKVSVLNAVPRSSVIRATSGKGQSIDTDGPETSKLSTSRPPKAPGAQRAIFPVDKNTSLNVNEDNSSFSALTQASLECG
jgi:hypothetical protein